VATAIGTYATAAGVKARLFAAGVTDTADDTLIGTICDQVNQFIEGPAGCGRIIAPISSATYTLDGDGSGWLYFPKGIRAITALSVGDYSGDTLDLLAASDYVLRPLEQDRLPGWPAFYVRISDRRVGLHGAFHQGYGTVSLTCTAGWAAIPDDLTMVALVTAVRAWGARQSGQADVVGIDDTGAPIVSQFVAREHWGIIRGYRAKQPAVIGSTGPGTFGYHRW
jgi:hypothetical protein